ncbi:MAG: glucosidase, partial [bacterium]
MTAEHARLREARAGRASWRLWGPYVSNRQWGTVREDYSHDGAAWSSFPHDHARSRAYRWSEDGLAGWCDKDQRLCLAVALWNGRDPILKERLFGLTNDEGNHGEDAKELWWHVDALPSHAWNRMLYAYPQRAYPYDTLVAANRARTRLEGEFELLDTGIFDDDRFFEVWFTYAKRAHDETLLRIEVVNRGPEEAEIHVIPQLFFRNTWSWRDAAEKPSIEGFRSRRAVAASAEGMQPMELRLADDSAVEDYLFCENETNFARVFGASPARTPDHAPKDAFHDRIVLGRPDAVHAHPRGTKAGAWHRLRLAAGERRAIDLVLVPPSSDLDPSKAGAVEEILALRKREADEFYEAVHAGLR